MTAEREKQLSELSRNGRKEEMGHEMGTEQGSGGFFLETTLMEVFQRSLHKQGIEKGEHRTQEKSYF